MKRALLAVVIPALLVAGAVVANAAEIYNKSGNKLELYGKVVGEHNFSISGEHNDADASYGQIGFKGETQVSEQITGYGQWEYSGKAASKVESNLDNATSLAFAGIKIKDVGSLDYGRNYGILYDVKSYTDMVPYFTGEAWANGYASNYMTNRSNGLLTYRSNNFFGLIDGLNLGIQYQGKNDHSSLKQDNGIGLSLGYEFGEGFGLIGAYSSANRSIDQKADGKGDKAESWAVGARYGANNIYLTTVYAETRNMSILGNNKGIIPASNSSDADILYNVANKTQNFEMMVRYQFDFGLRPFISYAQSKGKDLNSISDRDLVKYITTGATYYFNKNFNVYGDYRFNLLNDEGITTSSWNGSGNKATVGVTYQF